MEKKAKTISAVRQATLNSRQKTTRSQPFPKTKEGNDAKKMADSQMEGRWNGTGIKLGRLHRRCCMKKGCTTSLTLLDQKAN